MDKDAIRAKDIEADLLGVSEAELIDFLKEKSPNSPTFYAGSLFRWMHNKKEWDPNHYSDFPGTIKSILTKYMPIMPLEVKAKAESKDNSIKYVFLTKDGLPVETVFIPYKNRASVCISTQVGCKLNCSFCYSGRFGFQRNLSAGEILGQCYLVEKLQKRNISHIVYMGSGEPLDNWDNVSKSIQLLNSPLGKGISMRRITLSTAGIIPKIRALVKAFPQINLAISLHSLIDEERSKIMPINKRYPLAKLIPELISYQNKTHRQVTFEYIVLDGINNRREDIRAIKAISRHLDCHINLIAYNEIGKGMRKSMEVARAFLSKLKNAGISKATLRRSRGSDIAAACGQLLGEF